MNLKIYLLFLIIFISGISPKIAAADLVGATVPQTQLLPIEPTQPLSQKQQNQPRYNRILYRMGYITFGVGGTLIFSNLVVFAIIASFSRSLGFSFFLGMAWIYLLIISMSLFLILYAVRLIDDSVLIQSQSRQANTARAKKRFWLSLPLITVLAIAAFLSWFYYAGIVLIFVNAAMATLILVFTLWDARTHWQGKELEQEKNYE